MEGRWWRKEKGKEGEREGRRKKAQHNVLDIKSHFYFLVIFLCTSISFCSQKYFILKLLNPNFLYILSNTSKL